MHQSFDCFFVFCLLFSLVFILCLYRLFCFSTDGCINIVYPSQFLQTLIQFIHSNFLTKLSQNKNHAFQWMNNRQTTTPKTGKMRFFFQAEYKEHLCSNLIVSVGFGQGDIILAGDVRSGYSFILPVFWASDFFIVPDGRFR